MEVSWTARDGRLEVEVSLPVGTQAEVHLPGRAVEVVEHGQHRWDLEHPVPGPGRP